MLIQVLARKVDLAQAPLPPGAEKDWFRRARPTAARSPPNRSHRKILNVVAEMRLDRLHGDGRGCEPIPQFYLRQSSSTSANAAAPVSVFAAFRAH